MRRISYGDSFCGGGGSAAGARAAIARLNAMVDALDVADPANTWRRERFAFDLVGAINHDPKAIATHRAAHPEAHDRHYCTGVDNIDLERLFPPGIDLYWGSPSCREHSYAKRGKNIDAKDRASAWHVVHVARTRRPKRIIVENVTPFVKWSEAFDASGAPICSRKGETYRAWVAAIEAAGYTYEYRFLNSADYGVPQSRLRFFGQARCDGKPIVWPAATHDRYGRNGLPLWRGAIDVIDQRIPAESLYLRAPKDQLSDKTMERVIEGLRRYTLPQFAAAIGVDAARAIVSSFIVPLRNHSRPRAMDEPVPTVTASSGNQLYLAQAALEPYLVAHFGERPGQAPRTRSSRQPLWTVTGRAGDLVLPQLALLDSPPPLTPFVLGTHGGGVARIAHAPLPTITTKAFIRLFEPHLTLAGHTDYDAAKDPRPILLDNFGRRWRFDIFFRPFAVPELAAGQGFAPAYYFAGTQTDQKRMIGNAVPRNVADQLATAALSDLVTAQTAAAFEDRADVLELSA